MKPIPAIESTEAMNSMMLEADAGTPFALLAADCAAAVLEVIPAVMDALRKGMRRNAVEQPSVPQFRCLGFITRTPGCSVGAIAAFMGVTLPTASAMVDRLVRAGMVEPITATEDRRRLQLHASAAGLAQLTQIRQNVRDDIARVLSPNSQSELEQLAVGLALLRRNFLPEVSQS